MKLLSHEFTRLHKHAVLTLNLSPDTKPEVTRKQIAEFAKDLLTTMARKRLVKTWQLVLVEGEKE